MRVSGWCGVQVRGQLEVLRSACREVQGSQDFTTLLQAVLALGNHLNEGTHKGNASGTLLHPTPPNCTPTQNTQPYPTLLLCEHACTHYGATLSGMQGNYCTCVLESFLATTMGQKGALRGGGAYDVPAMTWLALR